MTRALEPKNQPPLAASGLGQQTQPKPIEGSDPQLPWLALGSLSIAIFASMATEFLPDGLLPSIAQEFAQSIAAVGQLIGIFAAAVVVATLPLSFLLRNMSRKTVLMISLGGIGIGNAVLALAPSFDTVICARLFGGVSHGVFWSVVFAYPTQMVASHQLGRAMAVTAAGGSLAGVVGIPLGNAVGQLLGWRAAFATMAGLTIIALCLLAWKLPPVGQGIPASSAQMVTLLGRDPSKTKVLFICLVILIFLIGYTSFTTYMTPWLIQTADFRPATIPAFLLTTGAAGAVGVVAAGMVMDRYPRVAFYAASLLVVLSLIALPLAAQTSTWVGLFIVAAFLSIAFSAVPISLQTRLMKSASPRSRNLAAALQTLAFNIGIGGGALLGGLATHHVGIQMLPVLAPIIVSLSVSLLFFSDVGESVSTRWKRNQGEGLQPIQ